MRSGAFVTGTCETQRLRPASVAAVGAIAARTLTRKLAKVTPIRGTQRTPRDPGRQTGFFAATAAGFFYRRLNSPNRNIELDTAIL
jgi:hypothetical protein